MVNASQPAPAPAARPYDEARWQAVCARILAVEGGYVNDAADPGGATNFGISLRFLVAEERLHPSLAAEFDINGDTVINGVDIHGMSREDAEDLYRDAFWEDTGFDTLPLPFDAALTDEGVNAGPGSAVKLLQLALNSQFRTSLFLTPIGVDGGLGPNTRDRLAKALAQFGQGACIDAYRAQAAGRYRDLVTKDPSLERFIDGWLNRASSLGNV